MYAHTDDTSQYHTEIWKYQSPALGGFQIEITQIQSPLLQKQASVLDILSKTNQVLADRSVEHTAWLFLSGKVGTPNTAVPCFDRMVQQTWLQNEIDVQSQTKPLGANETDQGSRSRPLNHILPPGPAPLKHVPLIATTSNQDTSVCWTWLWQRNHLRLSSGF